LLRSAVHARSVRAVGVAIHHAEPAVELGTRDVRLFVDRQEHALGDRELRRVAADLLQRLLQDRDAARERRGARAARATPRVGDGEDGGATDGAGVVATHQAGRVRLLHGLGRNGATLEPVDAAMVVDLRLGPQGPDQLDALPEPPDAVLRWDLELAVVLDATQ